MPEWTAEFVVGERLARRLLAEQFPELEPARLELLGEGWDNTAWLVDGALVFRFPRREIAVAGVRREIALLPALAPLLPLPVPVPHFVGRPSHAFPWPFFGGPVVPGIELARAELDEEQRSLLARPLAEFLRALHSADVAVDLPVDPIDRAEMPRRVARTRARLDELGGVPPEAEPVLEQALELPPPAYTAVVHGDLHLRHVLVDEGRLSGVIDWGDACRSDPAVDLVPVWCALSPGSRSEFFSVYGAVEEPALVRARVLSLFLCAVLAIHARAEGLADVERESLAVSSGR